MMVFDWFFRTKEENFLKELEKELKKAEFLDRILDNLINDKSGYETSIKNKINSTIKNLNFLLKAFHDKLVKQEHTLILYINTSIKQTDYLSEIKYLLSNIFDLLGVVDRDFHKDDYLTFIDETIKIRDNLKKQIIKLEQTMNQFHQQSKKSLEWNYMSGTGGSAIDKSDFDKKIKLIDGYTTPKSGTSHFNVHLKGYDGTLSPRQNSKKAQIATGTLRGFARQMQTDTKLTKLYEKYLICYFCHNNTTFKEIFVVKFSDLTI